MSSVCKLLLFSNSKNPGQGYLQHAMTPMRSLLGTIDRVTFIPHAAVTVTYDEYVAAVREALQPAGISVQSVHETDNPTAMLGEAKALVVGGGNTFRLLERLYAEKLIDFIAARCKAGVPYVGWSAGSNIACPTIMTTNDMPIIQPPRLTGMGLVPFQINPHYLDRNPNGHQGETREQRINEFTELNRNVDVVGLREGSALRIEGSTIELIGNVSARTFRYGRAPREIRPGDSLSFLLSGADPG